MEMLNNRAIRDPQYSTVHKVEVAMQKDEYLANAMKDIGYDQPGDPQTKERQAKIEEYKKAPEEKYNDEHMKLTIHKQQ